jgi:hypothetical protein
VAAEQANYHNLLARLGLSPNAIVAVEALGLDNLRALIDLTDDDIPAMVKEL